MNSEKFFTSTKNLSSDLINKILKIKHVALDMDGTIYNGGTLFPYSIDFLNKLSSLEIGYSFLTNNPSKSTEDYLEKLTKLGIQATKDQMYTSAQATIDYLKNNHPNVKKLFLLGTPSMINQFEKSGFISTEDSAEDEPDALVVAFDMTLNYSRLCRASWWAKQGKLYLATNPDKICPTDQSTVLIDCAAIYSAIETATDRQPDIILGKPQKEMLSGILNSKNLKPEEVAMVGDRIYTDMMMAHNSDALGILVLSGEATLEDAKNAEIEIDIVLPSIETLGIILEHSRNYI